MTDAAPEPAEPDSPPVFDMVGASTMQPGIVCTSCKRTRTVNDDYDYTPLQIFTGRKLGWFNGENEQMCGECLTKTMKGQIP